MVLIVPLIVLIIVVWSVRTIGRTREENWERLRDRARQKRRPASPPDPNFQFDLTPEVDREE